MRRLTTVALAGATAVFLGLALSAPPANAALEDDVQKCQTFPGKPKKGIEEQTGILRKAMTATLTKCMDLYRIHAAKEANNKATNFPAAAQTCENKLDVIMDLDENKTNKTATKRTDKLSKLADQIINKNTSCTADALYSAGHLVGGESAPPVGGGPADWVVAKIQVSTIADMIRDITVDYPDYPASINVLMTKAGVDCTGPSHPNLCAMKKDLPHVINGFSSQTGAIASMCHMHECELASNPQNPPSASHAVVRLALGGANQVESGVDVVALPLDGSTIFEFCKIDAINRFNGSVAAVPAAGTDLGGDFRVIRGLGDRGFKPAPLDDTTVVCVENAKAEGWCNCTGGSVALSHSYKSCIDHVAGSGASCSDEAVEGPPAESSPENVAGGECYCSAAPTPCGGLVEPPCVPIQPLEQCSAQGTCSSGNCIATDGGARCHPGSEISTDLDYTDASTPDTGCLINSATSLTVTDLTGAGSGVCTSNDADDNSVCTAVNVPNDCCSGLGTGSCSPQSCDVAGGDGCGTCVPEIGADGVPCTSDDILPRGVPASIPVTTGAAETEFADAQKVQGSCDADSTIPCVDDANCTGLTPATCSLGTVVSIDTETAALTVTGAGIACTGYESSDLGGWTYVNAFPFNDGSGLGDGVTRTTLNCE